MPPCVEARCPALAVDGERCAVHARGLQRHHVIADQENTLRCARCRRLIRDGEWFRTADGQTSHALDCLALKE